jgi:hypothetical protein
MRSTPRSPVARNGALSFRSSLAGAIALAAAGTAIASAKPALAAPTKEACIGAFDNAQRARRAGQLRTARAELLTCSQQECPSIVRADCTGVLRQVEAAQPTIVLKASDAKGNDLTDVTVELNDEKLTTALDGRALPVDPGKLSLVFRRPPWEPVTVDVVIAEAEKSRIVRATLGPPLPEETSSRRDEAPRSKRSTAGYIVPGVFAGLGAGALVFAGVNRLSLGDQADDLRARCAPECSQAERDRMSNDLVLTNVMLGAGIGSLVLAAATWFIFAPKSADARAQSALGAPFTW